MQDIKKTEDIEHNIDLEKPPSLFKKISVHMSVFIYPFLLILNLAFAGDILLKSSSIYYLIFLVAVAWVASDFVSGLVHWFFDSYGTPDAPIIGEFVHDFRTHHLDQKAICRSSFVYTVGSVALLTVLLMPLTFAMVYFMPNFYTASFTVFFSIVTTMTVMTNQIHKWAHSNKEDRPNLVIFLQNNKVLLNPEHHQIHHTYPHLENYCITVGWLNNGLNKVKFFRRIEAVLKKFGMESNRHQF